MYVHVAYLNAHLIKLDDNIENTSGMLLKMSIINNCSFTIF